MKTIWQFLGFIFCVFLYSIDISATPAYPKKIFVSTASGENVAIFLRGDERFRYGLSMDGYTLVHSAKGWFYAMKSDTAGIVASQYALMPYDKETDGLRAFKSATDKNILPSLAYIEENCIRRNSASAKSTLPSVVKGECRALVVLMQFRDFPMKFGHEDFVRLFNETGYNLDGAIGSVRDYFYYASDGQLDYMTDIYGPYTTNYNMSYYGANNSYSQDQNPLALAIEAVQQLPDDVDLSQYDNNGDGLVDNVHIIFSGYGEEAGAAANAIWSHEYPAILPIKIQGMKFAGYSCSPELRFNKGSSITRIGVACHELCHALGAMDYYDTNYGTGGDFLGTGCWDLMGMGNWNNDGISPAKPNPYIRAYDFGWSSVIAVSETGSYAIDENSIIRLETGSDGDYYLLENRQKQFFDASLPGDGLMIYHHHPKHEALARNNTINCTHPQAFYPVCASSTIKTPLTSRNYGDINGAGCAFSSNTNVVFSSESTPEAFAWDGTEVEFAISNIQCSGDEITFDAILSGDKVTEVRAVYTESFESGISDFTETRYSGTNGWATYPEGNFIQGTNNIPEIYDGKKHLQLFTGYKGSYISSSLESPVIALSPDSTYTFSCFYQCCNALGDTPPQFTLNVKTNDCSDIKTLFLNEAVGDWRCLKVKIPAGTYNLCYEMKGVVNTGGIFIDYVQVAAESGSTGVLSLQSVQGMAFSVDDECLFLSSAHLRQCSIYSINGKLIYPVFEVGTVPVCKQLEKGIYIIRTEGGESFVLRI